MESIKTITIKDKTYLIQASVDDKGRVISETYLTKELNLVNWEDVNNKPETITNIDQKLLNKVDKEDGKGLSEENFTTEDKTKLSGIAEGANNYTHPANHPASIITQDATHRFVTDTEKSTWNNKANAEDIPDVSGFATTAQLNNKLDTSTYNSDKATFATKSELGAKLDSSTYNSEKTNFATKDEIGNINTILDNINGEVI